MKRSKYGPAAGASGGAAPRLADMKVPTFIRLEGRNAEGSNAGSELHTLLHVLRDPLATAFYLLLVAHADFKTGDVPLTTYARFLELLTPPQPERGPRRAGPTMAQLRRVLDDLEAFGLVRRDRAQNAAQGQLRLHVTPRDKRGEADAKRASQARATLAEMAREIRKTAPVANLRQVK